MMGVTPPDVENLLSFLYAGEVWIPNGELQGFIRAAKILRIDRIEIEQNSDTEDIPRGLITKPEKTPRPFQNINLGNIQAPCQRTPGHRSTHNLFSISELDQENLTGVSSFQNSTILQDKHKGKISFRHSQNHSIGIKPKLRTKSRGRVPEKFRNDLAESEDVNSLVEPNNLGMEDSDSMTLDNFPLPTPLQHDRAMGEDSWKAFQFQNVETSRETTNTEVICGVGGGQDGVQAKDLNPLSYTASPQLQETRGNDKGIERVSQQQQQEKYKLKNLLIVLEDCMKGKKMKTPPKKERVKVQKRPRLSMGMRAREKLRRKCKRDTLWAQKQTTGKKM